MTELLFFFVCIFVFPTQYGKNFVKVIKQVAKRDDFTKYLLFRSQCGHYGNFLSDILSFDENFVKPTFLFIKQVVNKELISQKKCFDEREFLVSPYVNILW